jgi:hypothetical protein
MDKVTIELISGFLSVNYEAFQSYLSIFEIDPTEAEIILDELEGELRGKGRNGSKAGKDNGVKLTSPFLAAGLA